MGMILVKGSKIIN